MPALKKGKNMKIILTDGYIKNGEIIKEVEIKEKITIGMEEEALDMCIILGKAKNMISAEMCSLAVATGLTYDDIKNLSSYDYDLLRSKYYFFYNTPKRRKQSEQENNLTPEQA